MAGEPKVAVIVADSANVPLGAEDGWVIETFASRDPAEFDPSTDDQLPVDIWLDADDNRVPTSTITVTVVSSGCRRMEPAHTSMAATESEPGHPPRIQSGVDENQLDLALPRCTTHTPKSSIPDGL